MTEIADSVLMSDVHQNQNIRRRVVALVQNARWDTAGANVKANMDLDIIMWGVASSDAIMTEIKATLAGMSSEDSSNTDRALISSIQEATLKAATVAALNRIYPKWKDADPQ